MPPMEQERHESLLTELLNPELEHSRRTEILQEFRVQHSTDTSDFAKFTTDIGKLQKDNSDLVLSNSKLFRQLGVTGNPEKEKEEEEKEFSETVTLEQLEKRV